MLFLSKLLNEIITNYSFERAPNVYIYNGVIFSYVKMLFTTLVFHQISSSNLLKKGSLIGFVIYLFALTFFLIFNGDESDYNKTPSAFQGILVIALSILYFYEQIRKPETLFVYALPDFWFVTAVFIHAAGTFFIYIFAEFWLQDQTNADDYINIFSSLTIFYNIVIGFALWKKQPDSSLSNNIKPISA